MSLAQIQRDFRAYLETGATSIEPRVTEAARRGLPVYHHAYRANLGACLRDTFEKTLAWLGDEAFERAALAHIAHHPPHSWTLGDYGASFPQTLAERYLADPEVEELAWLDWTLRRAFDGPDAVAQDSAEFAGVDWEHAVLRTAPTLALRPITTNSTAIWSAIAEGVAAPEAADLQDFRALAVWRNGLSPQFRSVPETEYHALGRAVAGVPFGVICAEITTGFDDPGDATAFVGGLLAGWLADKRVLGADNL